MPSLVSARLGGDEAGGVNPLTHFLLERLALIDFDLAVVGDRNRVPLQGARRRAFEVDPVLVKSAAVARAFELLLSFKPIGRAPQVGAHTLERENLLLAVVFG